MGFSNLLNQLLMSASKEVQMSGSASPTVVTNMGTMRLQDIPFWSKVTLRGFSGFNDPKTGASLMKVKGLDVVGGGSGSLDLIADTEIMNPSNVAASMGALSLDMYTAGDGTCSIPDGSKEDCGYYNIQKQDCLAKGCCWSPPTHSEAGFFWCYHSDTVRLGTLHIDNFALQANSDGTYVNSFPHVKATYTPPVGSSAAAGRKFLSNFVNGVSQKVLIRGFSAGTNIPLLGPAISSFKTSSTAPGLVNNRLLQKGL